MRFYYISIFSVMLLGLIYLVGTVLLAWFGLWLRKRWNKAWMVMVPLFLLLYTSPVAEEFWIAWNFGQLCKKDAGIFVYKAVEADGFYDATGGSFELIRSGQYRWIESPSRERAGAERLTLGDAEFTRQAFEKYEKQQNVKPAAEREYFRVAMDDRTEALVFPEKRESWRIAKLEHPTARYHYGKDSGMRMVHKIFRQSSSVVDSVSQETLGSYVRYSRRAPWFFIGLDDPGFGCDGPDGGPETKQSFLIYREVLQPIVHR